MTSLQEIDNYSTTKINEILKIYRFPISKDQYLNRLLVISIYYNFNKIYENDRIYIENDYFNEVYLYNSYELSKYIKPYSTNESKNHIDIVKEIIKIKYFPISEDSHINVENLKSLISDKKWDIIKQYILNGIDVNTKIDYKIIWKYNSHTNEPVFDCYPTTILIESIKRDAPKEFILFLLDSKADVNLVGQALYHAVIKYVDIEIFKIILQYTKDFSNIGDIINNSNYERKILIIKKAIHDNGVDYIYPKFFNYTLLNIAVIYHDAKLVEYLLKNDADPNLKKGDEYLNSNLFYAFFNSSKNIVEILLNYGAKFYSEKEKFHLIYRIGEELGDLFEKS